MEERPFIGLFRIALQFEKRESGEIFTIRYRWWDEFRVVERFAFGFPCCLGRGPSAGAAPVFLGVEEEDEGGGPKDGFHGVAEGEKAPETAEGSGGAHDDFPAVACGVGQTQSPCLSSILF